MSKHPQAGRAIRKLRKTKSPADALAILAKLPDHIKAQIQK